MLLSSDSTPNNDEHETRDSDVSKGSHSRHSRQSLSRHSVAYAADPPDAAGRKSILTGVAGYIIVTEFCERLAYFGFAGSLVLFFQTQMNYSNSDADVQYSAWQGVCYVTPLLGGYIADTYLGRYYTILIFISIYLVGLVMVVLGSIPGHVSPAVFFPAIYIVSLGTGGIKPNVSTLGADQFDERYSADRKEKESFFNWFYWSINLGALISYTLVAYICQYGAGPDLGGEEWGFFVGYTIPSIMMTIAIVIFIAGTPKYKLNPPKGSVVATAVKICVEAYWTKRSTLTGTEHSLDKAKTTHGGSFSNNQVEGVKLVTRLVPYLALIIPYWGIYSQMSTAFQNQGCQMNLELAGAEIPVSALSCFDTLAILALVPVFDQVIYPYCKKAGYPLSMLQKIGWGFALALLAMMVAAFVEMYRLAHAPTPGGYDDVSARDNITPCQNIDDFNPYNYQDWAKGGDTDEPMYCHQTCDTTVPDANGVPTLILACITCDDIPQMSNISVMWQAFQFSLVGASEILAAITSLEFFYSQAPTSMRSVTQSLNLFTNALGSFSVIPLLLIVNSDSSNEWVPTNLDDGHLDYYFFLLAGLMGLTICVFAYVSKDYVYKTQQELAQFEDTATAEALADEDDTLGNASHNGLLDTDNKEVVFNTLQPRTKD
mmetsp:Transcript_53490/g.93341  ORF Transcript_53490/g.93341 Transcript_53490/m.93341 type:complete len:657 (-) Transcript_53490:348-2318(-)|eukprot:CAMPEP_0185009944 /NCGR_PEP_ID=MMETSP1098-20130426/93548_1 /TAXON_ID=89044 /ORGANISM="Spumella elongata, Strain CCAP 955/1" /LENGTH=656 /DNA_ID=CAMNT_0027538719 /DNA_START=55 /DNA_END=2025 /DNA_ORIENTATION=+